PRETHRVLVGFRSGVDEEDFGQRRRSLSRDRRRGARPYRESDDVGVEEKLLRLLANCANNFRVAMPGRGDGMSRIQVEIAFARIVPDRRARAPNDGERPARVGRQLRGERRRRVRSHGKTPVIFRPVGSGIPNMMFIAWIAWPAAPLTRLSMATKTFATLP